VTDDLSAPLGQAPAKKRFAMPPGLLSALPWTVVAALGSFLAVFALWAVLVDDPYGGEPIVVASTDQRTAPAARKDEPAQAAPIKDAAPGSTPRPDDVTMPAPKRTGRKSRRVEISGERHGHQKSRKAAA